MPASGLTRTPVNPTDWAKAFLNQGEIIEGAKRFLHLSGQISVKDDPDAPFGVSARHPGDMRAQMQEALDNIDAVLAEAGMGRGDIIHMRFFVTDMSEGLGAVDVMMDWLGDLRPPQSFIGVNELVLPGLMIEIEATAAQ